MKRLAHCLMAVTGLLLAAPAGAREFSEPVNVAASVARPALLTLPALLAPLQIRQYPAGGGLAADTANTWTADQTFNDNVKIIFGTGGDTELYFDATNFLIAAQAGGVSFPGLAGTGNEVIGAGAGAALVAGADQNTLFGVGAGAALNNASSDSNTLMGHGAGDLLTTAVNTAAFGRDACNTTTIGNSNTCLGTGSDGASASAASFVAVGLSANATSSSVAVGASTIVRLDQGVAVGASAETADGISIGYQAGDASAAADRDNTLIGNGAGGLLNGTSTDNTCAGDLCLASLTTGDRNTTLGANTDVGTATDSDSTVVGEGLVGKGSSTMLLGMGSGRETYFCQGVGKALTESIATAIVRVSVATESYTGARIRWRVLADDGTDFQSLSGETTIDVVNKAGTETCQIRTTPAFGAAVEAASAGTLALDADPTCVSGAADTVDVLLDATSSLIQTTLDAYYCVEVVGPTTTITPQ